MSPIAGAPLRLQGAGLLPRPASELIARLSRRLSHETCGAQLHHPHVSEVPPLHAVELPPQLVIWFLAQRPEGPLSPTSCVRLPHRIIASLSASPFPSGSLPPEATVPRLSEQ